MLVSENVSLSSLWLYFVGSVLDYEITLHTSSNISINLDTTDMNSEERSLYLFVRPKSLRICKFIVVSIPYHVIPVHDYLCHEYHVFLYMLGESFVT
jgi:hypothetical protein